jgi:hypothetical protein
MSYYGSGETVHTLSVTGKISTEAALLLVNCEEALHKLGFTTNLVLSITRDKPQTYVDVAAIEVSHG